MLDMILGVFNQCMMYQVTLVTLLVLILDSVGRMKELRYALSAIVYLTIGLWYFVDPVYRAIEYSEYQPELNRVYFQVLTFLISFRVFISVFAKRTESTTLRNFDARRLDRGGFLQILLITWFVLFCIGMYRADFRFVDALFPVGARWSGAQMWSRGRFGGATDFLVSVGFYSYLMCCAVFGIVAVGSKKGEIKLLMLVLIALTWPMFALSGSRSMFVTVVLPTILAFLIMKRWSRLKQVVFLGCCFLVINTLMLVSIEYRSRGVSKFFQEESMTKAIEKTKHAGLNMAEELVYINRYHHAGLLEPELGYEYFAQAINFVPRAIWPNKPFPGREFAALRVGYLNGFVAATISNGVVGQGVQNFGTIVGPIAPAMILAIMIAWICKLPLKGDPFLRACLVIFFMGLIPNLGRDLTLMTLWPAIFATVGVMAIEKNTGGSRRRQLSPAGPARQTIERPATSESNPLL